MPRDWDAESYHRVSTPQQAMAREVLERLPLRGDETVLDAGCGSGRVTEMLLERLPEGHVIGVDASAEMVAKAREHLTPFGDRVELFVTDLTELELEGTVDAVVSTATFHWIADHDALFDRLASAMRPRARLVAQWGGEGNIGRARERVEQVQRQSPYAEHFAGWEPPWHYESAEDTAIRLRRAGFVDVECWLQPWPVVPDHPDEFLRTVIAGPHLEQLPDELREPFLADVAAAFDGRVELDYVRLNIEATRDPTS